MISYLIDSQAREDLADITQRPDLALYANAVIPTINVDEAYAFNADTYLDIQPISDSDNPNRETVHPSVLYFPLSWNGWKYWKGITPYPGTNSAFENPCIMVSNDGDTWQTPAGLTNPIFPKPTGYNSDPFLIMSPDNATMYLVFRSVHTNIEIWVAESIDGVNWSTKYKTLTFTATVEDAASPTILYDGTQYVMWAVDLVASPKVIKKRTAQSIYGPWSASTTCTIAAPAEKEFWHIDVLYTGSQFIMLAMVGNVNGSGASGLLYLASSTDGDTWTVSSNPVLYGRDYYFDGGLYKSSGILTIENNNPVIDLFYGCHGTFWKTSRTKIKFDKTKMFATKDIALGKPLNTKIPLVFGDNFTRANSAESLGTSSSGDAWTGSGWGISNNQAYLPSATNSRAIRDIGIADFEAVVEFSVLGDGLWLIARYVDENNFFRFGFENDTYNIQKILNGEVPVSVAVTPHKAPTAGDKFKIICRGNSITVQKLSTYGYCDFVDGETTITDASFNTATKVGIQSANTTTRVERFAVNRLV